MPDLTKLILHSGYNAFKNNNIFTDSLTISGTVTAGTNTKIFTVDLGITPDLMDIIFKGPADPVLANRTDDEWFKSDYPSSSFDSAIFVETDDGFNSHWYISNKISGTNLVVTATYIKTFISTSNLTSTDFFYRVVDYSVF